MIRSVMLVLFLLSACAGAQPLTAKPAERDPLGHKNADQETVSHEAAHTAQSSDD